MLPLFSSISTCLGGFFSPSISQGRVLGALSEGLGCWHLLKFSPDKCYYLEILIFFNLCKNIRQLLYHSPSLPAHFHFQFIFQKYSFQKVHFPFDSSWKITHPKKAWQSHQDSSTKPQTFNKIKRDPIFSGSFYSLAYVILH